MPIGGTDFSTRGYTYSDANKNATLAGFNLTEEDFKYKVSNKTLHGFYNGFKNSFSRILSNSVPFTFSNVVFIDVHEYVS